MSKRVVVKKGDDSLIVWECDLETMKSYGWIPIMEIHSESQEEIEDGDF